MTEKTKQRLETMIERVTPCASCESVGMSSIHGFDDGRLEGYEQALQVVKDEEAQVAANLALLGSPEFGPGYGIRLTSGEEWIVGIDGTSIAQRDPFTGPLRLSKSMAMLRDLIRGGATVVKAGEA